MALPIASLEPLLPDYAPVASLIPMGDTASGLDICLPQPEFCPPQQQQPPQPPHPQEGHRHFEHEYHLQDVGSNLGSSPGPFILIRIFSLSCSTLVFRTPSTSL